MDSDLHQLIDIYAHSQSDPKSIDDGEIHIYPNIESVLSNIKSEEEIIFVRDEKDLKFNINNPYIYGDYKLVQWFDLLNLYTTRKSGYLSGIDIVIQELQNLFNTGYIGIGGDIIFASLSSTYLRNLYKEMQDAIKDFRNRRLI